MTLPANLAVFEAEFYAIEAKRNDAMDKLATKVRKALIPVCKKYDLEFTAGMGSYSFDLKGVCPDDFSRLILRKDDAVRAGLADLVPFFDVLDLRLDQNNSLGTVHMGDID